MALMYRRVLRTTIVITIAIQPDIPLKQPLRIPPHHQLLAPLMLPKHLGDKPIMIPR